MTETWRAIPGYEGYEVSDAGNVRSWVGNGRGRAKEPRLLKQKVDHKGYLRFMAYAGRVGHCVLVHRAVLLAFVGPPQPGHEGRHLNGIRTDPELQNLAWGSAADNWADRRRHGTDTTGERNGCAKLCEAQVREIRTAHASGEVTQAELGRRYGVTPQAVYLITKRRKWAHVPDDVTTGEAI